MKIPENIKIMGHTYTITNDYSINENMFKGGCSTEGQSILIGSMMHDEHKFSILLHEILHALDYYAELKLPHQTITVLAEMIFQVLNDNNFLV